MSARHICPLATDQWRFHTPIILLGYALMVSTPATAAEIITMEVESEVLDLDAGTVVDALTEDLTTPTGADLQLAYNADLTPHAVVFPVGEGVELAFVASVGFDGISSSDVSNLAFSTEPIDLPFSANDCVVIRTDQGMVFKLGNAIESGMSITFNYEPL
jgi:hypothetical protein